ncbi:MAG: ferredoxin reductase [Microthrixaceae bacterium]
MTTVLDRLASPLNVDSFLSTFNPLWGAKLQGVIESIVAVTPDSASIRIRPGRSWQGHVAGQFVTLGVDIEGVRHHRCFSLTSVPDAPDGLIEISVHCGETGFVSRHLIHDARPGDVVQLTQAEGQFTLQSALQGDAPGDVPRDAPSGLGRLAPAKLLFITGGSGITPAMGIVRTIAATSDQPSDVVLLHHAPTPGQMMFHSELEQLAGRADWLSFNPTFTAQGGRHLDLERLELECPDWSEREVFVCGPAPLLDFVQDHWSSVGLDEHVHVERFVIGLAGRPASKRTAIPNEAVPDESDGAAISGITTFSRSGSEVPSEPDRPLLEVAEAAGLAPVFGCRMGICHTCTTRLDKGCVTDLRDGRIHEAGSHVQICVSAAVSDVSLEL